MSKSIQCYPKKLQKTLPRKLVLENTIGRILVDQLPMQPDFFWQNTGNKCSAGMRQISIAVTDKSVLQ